MHAVNHLVSIMRYALDRCSKISSSEMCFHCSFWIESQFWYAIAAVWWVTK